MKSINKILGIDIDSNFIKIVEVESVSDGITINSFGSIGTPANTIEEGVITSPRAVAGAILKVVSKSRMQAKKAVISIRSPHTLLRLERLPFMREDQIRLAVQKEVGQYTVFRGKEPVFDTHIVEELSEEGTRKMNVLFAVASKALCNSYIKTAELAGLEILSIDASQVSILRALDRTNLKISGLEAMMLVEINSGSIDVCIVKGDKIRFSHTVKIDSSAMEKNIDLFAEKIVSALKLVLNFYQAKYVGGEAVTKIILACDMYPLLPLKEKLQAKLERFSIDIGNPIGDMLVDKRRIPDEKTAEMQFFTCAIGAALEAGSLSDYPVKLDLTPGEKLERVELTKLIRFLNIVLGAALGVYLIFAGFLFIDNMAAQHQIRSLQQELKKPDPLLRRVNTIFEEKSKIERQIQNGLLFLGELSSSVVPWDRVFINAMVNVPVDLWLISISSEKDGIRIRGRAYSEEPMFKFIKSLEGSFYFDSAKLVSSQNIIIEEKEQVEFMISCDLKEKK